jgi:hypothetical protein
MPSMHKPFFCINNSHTKATDKIKKQIQFLDTIVNRHMQDLTDVYC